MSNINLILENNLPTVGDVGAGYGKEIGSFVGGHLNPFIGAPIGYGAGYFIGKHTPDHPKKQMNPKSRFHRFGAMLNNRNKLKNIAITAIGAGLGAAIGGVGHNIKHGNRPKLFGKKEYHNSNAASIGSGAALGAAIAHHLFGAGKDNRKLAKKLGYKTVGRIGASFTPLTGLFHPDSQKDD